MNLGSDLRVWRVLIPSQTGMTRSRKMREGSSTFFSAVMCWMRDKPSVNPNTSMEGSRPLTRYLKSQRSERSLSACTIIGISSHHKFSYPVMDGVCFNWLQERFDELKGSP